MTIQELARNPALFIAVCALIGIALSFLLIGWINWTSTRSEAKRKARESEQAIRWKTAKPTAPKPFEFWR